MYKNNAGVRAISRLNGMYNPHVVAGQRALDRQYEREREAAIAATPEGKKAAREQALRLDEARREEEHQKRVAAVAATIPKPAPKPLPKPLPESPAQEPLGSFRRSRTAAVVVEKAKRRLEGLEASQKAKDGR